MATNEPTASKQQEHQPPQPNLSNSTTPQHQNLFYIFGANISSSKSPQMHNAAFAHHNLSTSHSYSIREIDSIAECEPLIRSPRFKGASVTMPYKLSIAAFCDTVTDEARLMGAVNTLSVHHQVHQEGVGGGKRVVVRGDNTDWSGLLQCIQQRYPHYDAAAPPKVGWVIGAGGASRAAVYALHKAGVERIFISNRTLSRAQGIADSFAEHGIRNVVCIEKWEGMNAHPADVVIGTVPAETVSEAMFEGVEWKKGEGGLCIDMSYKPRVTPLMRVARQQEGWETANGLDALLEQGLIQFGIWTGLEAPRGVMREAILAEG